MIKIPCLFERDFGDGKCEPKLLETVTPGCEWVLAGEGLATRKWDGTACLVKDGKLYARFDVKVDQRNGKRKTLPGGGLVIPCTPEPDPVTGHWPHWIEVGDHPQYKWHREAMAFHLSHGSVADGTYECCGPKLQTNAEQLDQHVLIRHGNDVLVGFERSFAGIREYLRPLDIEGIVFHRGNGQMCKIRKADYGMPRRAP